MEDVQEHRQDDIAGELRKDLSGLFNSSLDGNAKRAIDIHEGEKVDETALKDLIRAAVVLNAGAESKPRRASRKRADQLHRRLRRISSHGEELRHLRRLL